MATIDVRQLRDSFGLSQEHFARMLGFSTRSVAGWERSSRPGSRAYQRLVESQRLFDELATVIRPEIISRWLQSPCEAFEGRTPLQVIELGHIDRIWTMIYHMRSGTPG